MLCVTHGVCLGASIMMLTALVFIGCRRRSSAWEVDRDAHCEDPIALLCNGLFVTTVFVSPCAAMYNKFIPSLFLMAVWASVRQRRKSSGVATCPGVKTCRNSISFYFVVARVTSCEQKAWDGGKRIMESWVLVDRMECLDYVRN
jgi:hypothetical protein